MQTQILPDTQPPDIQEVTTAQLRQFVVESAVNCPDAWTGLSDELLEDLIETTGFDPARSIPGGRFSSRSNCDGTHFLIHVRHTEVPWPPRCIKPIPANERKESPAA
jgi:hypothetical protein